MWALVLVPQAAACAGTGQDTSNQATQVPASAPNLTLMVTIENDVFTGSDNNYTNGLGISIQSDERRTYSEGSFTRRWMDFWSFLPEIGNEDCQTYATWTLGQEIFTPDDITDPDPPADDQPYAGVLFLDSTLYARTRGLTHAWNSDLGSSAPRRLPTTSSASFTRSSAQTTPRDGTPSFPTSRS